LSDHGHGSPDACSLVGLSLSGVIRGEILIRHPHQSIDIIAQSSILASTATHPAGKYEFLENKCVFNTYALSLLTALATLDSLLFSALCRRVLTHRFWQLVGHVVTTRDDPYPYSRLRDRQTIKPR
jgi:hypothetical protein